jgi:hypothetical protein
MSRSHEQLADRTVSATCGGRTHGMKGHLSRSQATHRCNLETRRRKSWQNEAA